MSYCRFSSNDWRSDVYCYECWSGGFVINVASNRILGDIPPSRWDLLQAGDSAGYLAAHRAQMAFLEKAERQKIGGPHDGAHFIEDSLEDCKARLLALRAAGYHVPEHALAAIEEEMRDGA